MTTATIQQPYSIIFNFAHVVLAGGNLWHEVPEIIEKHENTFVPGAMLNASFGCCDAVPLQKRAAVPEWIICPFESCSTGNLNASPIAEYRGLIGI